MAPITGRKVFFFTAACFGVIIAVNLVMAVQAVRTFPGLEVKNSYVASQSFDAERTAQEALGWVLEPRYDGKRLVLEFTDSQGNRPDVAALAVLIGRSTEARDDVSPEFARGVEGFSAPVVLEPGKWLLRVEAEARDGTAFRQRLTLVVKG